MLRFVHHRFDPLDPLNHARTRIHASSTRRRLHGTEVLTAFLLPGHSATYVNNVRCGSLYLARGWVYARNFQSSTPRTFEFFLPRYRIDHKYDRSRGLSAFEYNAERSLSLSLSSSPVTRFFVLRFSIRSRARIYPLEPAYRYFHPWPGSEISICYLKYQSSPRGPQDKLFVHLGG